ARPALRRTQEAADLKALADLAIAEGSDTYVVGLPLNMDGSEGPQAAAARAFGAKLAAAGGAVEFVDERLTSWQAREELAGAGQRPSRSSGELDSVAARLILQEYLDARRAPARRLETE
ncbi:MAG: Holliday junction resolvase RuvX, partial [Chloroflexota bacterium]|nr:Holliday junction resolvase RuvX [Chloroflexota bacterium]